MLLSFTVFVPPIIGQHDHVTEVKARRPRISDGEHQGRPVEVNLGPFVGFKYVSDRLYSRYRAETDVKWIKPKAIAITLFNERDSNVGSLDVMEQIVDGARVKAPASQKMFSFACSSQFATNIRVYTCAMQLIGMFFQWSRANQCSMTFI